MQAKLRDSLKWHYHEFLVTFFFSVFQEKVYGSQTYQAKLKKERGNDPLNKLTGTDN